MADNDLIFNIIAQEQYKAQLAEAYATVNRMTDAEKQQAVAAHDAAQADSELGKATKEAGDSAKESVQGFESFRGTLVAVQSGVALAQEAIAGLKQVWDFAKEGAANQQIAASFERTAKSIGGNANEIVAALDAAAKGTVDDEELMQASTRALTLGVAQSGEDLVKVMQLARSAALAFGGDTGQAFETINYAIGNLAPRALKQFGIIVSLKEANDAYAKSLGLSADALTEEQQRQALLNAVLEQGTKNFGDIANAATTTGEKMKAVETRLANILDIAKEVAATGFETAFTITDAPKNMLEAFVGTAEKMKVEVNAGRMSVEDYNNGLRGMANNLTAVLPGALADSAYNTYKLDAALIALGKDSNEGTRQLQYTAQAARDLAEKQAAASTAAQRHTQVMREYSRQLLESVDAYQRTKINVADTTSLAIQYTEAQQKQTDVQTKLDELNAKIAARGPVRSVQVQNERLNTEDLTRAQLQLAVVQEDLATAQRKGGETDAEFALRVDTLKGKVADYSKTLGTHTAVVGGATKAEQEQKAALEEQIATLQKTAEIDRAKGAFESLTAAFRSGALTEGQYQERSAALNSVAHLYTDTALQQATAQEVLMKSFADPRSEVWRGQLLKNEEAIDGQVNKTKELTAATEAAHTAMVKAGVSAAKAEAAAARPVDDAEVKRLHDLAGDVKYKQPVITANDQIAASAKTVIESTGKIADSTSTNIGLVSDRAKTKGVDAATSIAQAMTNMAMTVAGDLNSVRNLVDSLPTFKEFVYKITVKEDSRTRGLPGGAQHGADFYVPPNPRGGSGDYFPLLAAPGEHVVITPAGTASAKPPTQNVTNNTYNLYDALAAKQVTEQQRIERLKSLTGAM